MSEVIDVTKHIQAKSDQLNADDLITGPITVQILGVTAKETTGDQPVQIKISGGHMPFRPSKTALRVLVACWGTDAAKWVGRWMTLYRDNTVLWAGVAVGGIRIKAVSHIPAAISLSLQYSKGKKSSHAISVLKTEDQRQQGVATANLDALLTEHELERDDLDRYLAAKKSKPLAERDAEAVAKLAVALAAKPETFAEIKAMRPASTTNAPAEEDPLAPVDEQVAEAPPPKQAATQKPATKPEPKPAPKAEPPPVDDNQGDVPPGM